MEVLVVRDFISKQKQKIYAILVLFNEFCFVFLPYLSGFLGMYGAMFLEMKVSSLNDPTADRSSFVV